MGAKAIDATRVTGNGIPQNQFRFRRFNSAIAELKRLNNSVVLHGFAKVDFASGLVGEGLGVAAVVRGLARLHQRQVRGRPRGHGRVGRVRPAAHRGRAAAAPHRALREPRRAPRRADRRERRAAEVLVIL